MSSSSSSYHCPECAKMLRLVGWRAADAERIGVTCGDPMQRRDIWKLLDSELRPPRHGDRDRPIADALDRKVRPVALMRLGS